jgi:hypothetical protein
MDWKIKLPTELQMAIAHERFPNRAIAVFVNGALMCPDQPDDQGDYSISGSEVELHAVTPNVNTLLTITDFGTFRWIHQNGHWHKL